MEKPTLFKLRQAKLHLGIVNERLNYAKEHMAGSDCEGDINGLINGLRPILEKVDTLIQMEIDRLHKND